MAMQASELATPEDAVPEPASAARPGAARQRLRFLRGHKAAAGLAIFGIFVILAVIGPWIAPYDPSAMSNAVLKGPSWQHLFGTTQTGQDVFSQVLVGTRSVMVVGLIAGGLASVLSVLIGVSAGYLGGAGDEVLSSLSNIFLVLPALPLIIIIASMLDNSGDVVIGLVIALTSWAWGARVLRAQTLSLRNRDYVQAAKATGEPTWRIIVFEILPNLTAIIASSFVGTVIFAIITEITLAFVGVTDPSHWSWGTVLYWAQNNQALGNGNWWWFVPAGLCMAVLGTALTLINFGIDEFVNPRLRTGGRAERKLRMRVGFTPVVLAPVATARPDAEEGKKA